MTWWQAKRRCASPTRQNFVPGKWPALRMSISTCAPAGRPLELRDNGVSLEANLSPLCAVPLDRHPRPDNLCPGFGVGQAGCSGLRVGRLRHRLPASRFPDNASASPIGRRPRSRMAWRKAVSGFRNWRCRPRSMLAQQACAYRIMGPRAKRSARAPVSAGAIRSI